MPWAIFAPIVILAGAAAIIALERWRPYDRGQPFLCSERPPAHQTVPPRARPPVDPADQEVHHEGQEVAQ